MDVVDCWSSVRFREIIWIINSKYEYVRKYKIGCVVDRNFKINYYAICFLSIEYIYFINLTISYT